MQERKYHNGRRHLIATKQKARELRAAGYTHLEIVDKLNVAVSVSTVFEWTKYIILNLEQKQAIQSRRNRSAVKWTDEQKKELGKRLAPFQYKQKYTDHQLLEMIKNFYIRNGRIPLKREFEHHNRVFCDRFGTWNKAIIAAGFEPNPVLFADRKKADDGHMCDSFHEMLIDNWFSVHKVQHERNIPYPGSKMTVDFSLSGGVFVEYFGLAGVQQRYDHRIKKKRLICRKQGIELLEIYPSDFSFNSFERDLNRLLGCFVSK